MNMYMFLRKILPKEILLAHYHYTYTYYTTNRPHCQDDAALKCIFNAITAARLVFVVADQDLLF